MALRKGSCRARQFTLVLLPARSPELNPVENIWQFVRDNWLSSRVFGSYPTWSTIAAMRGTA